MQQKLNGLRFHLLRKRAVIEGSNELRILLRSNWGISGNYPELDYADGWELRDLAGKPVGKLKNVKGRTNKRVEETGADPRIDSYCYEIEAVFEPVYAGITPPVYDDIYTVWANAGNALERAREVLDNSDEDRLAHMFKVQEAFADVCFDVNALRDNKGQLLTCRTVAEESRALKLGVNDLPRRWLAEMQRAISAECEEIGLLLPWKHWSKEEIGEKEFQELSREERMTQLAIEFIDIWHFLMEALIFLGIDPQRFYELYLGKCSVNLERMQSGYNTAHKTEEDNIQLGKKFVEKG